MSDEVDRVIEVLISEPPTGDSFTDRSAQLAVLWPTLAAALAELLTARGQQPSRGLRRAANVVRAEKYDSEEGCGRAN